MQNMMVAWEEFLRKLQINISKYVSQLAQMQVLARRWSSNQWKYKYRWWNILSDWITLIWNEHRYSEHAFFIYTNRQIIMEQSTCSALIGYWIRRKQTVHSPSSMQNNPWTKVRQSKNKSKECDTNKRKEKESESHTHAHTLANYIAVVYILHTCTMLVYTSIQEKKKSYVKCTKKGGTCWKLRVGPGAWIVSVKKNQIHCTSWA